MIIPLTRYLVYDLDGASHPGPYFTPELSGSDRAHCNEGRSVAVDLRSGRYYYRGAWKDVVVFTEPVTA